MLVYNFLEALKLRLDKYLIKQDGISRKKVLHLLTAGKVLVDGEVVTDRDFEVSQFNRVAIEGAEYKTPQKAHYIMLNKPQGILSATKDSQHQTAIDLITEEFKNQLHIAGRLDRSSTGLLILTNDGKWSRRLTEPKQKIPKTYFVKTAYAISPDTQARFAQGIYFAYEDITTSPAQIELLSESSCILTIYEGRYHQIKRMFAAVGNRVQSLHRLSMGEIVLDKNLKPGEYRALTKREIDAIKQA